MVIVIMMIRWWARWINNWSSFMRLSLTFGDFNTVFTLQHTLLLYRVALPFLLDTVALASQLLETVVLQSLLLVKVTPFEGSGVGLSWQQNIRNDMYLCLYSQVILPQPLSCLHYNFQFHRLHQLHLPSYLCDYHVISFKWVRKMWYLWVSQGQFCEIMVIFQKLLTYTYVPWWSPMEAADLNKPNK